MPVSAKRCGRRWSSTLPVRVAAVRAALRGVAGGGRVPVASPRRSVRWQLAGRLRRTAAPAGGKQAHAGHGDLGGVGRLATKLPSLGTGTDALALAPSGSLCGMTQEGRTFASPSGWRADPTATTNEPATWAPIRTVVPMCSGASGPAVCPAVLVPSAWSSGRRRPRPVAPPLPSAAPRRGARRWARRRLVGTRR